eukprot:1149697-Pelagomonas_calceolata.AAC.4
MGREYKRCKNYSTEFKGQFSHARISSPPLPGALEKSWVAPSATAGRAVGSKAPRHNFHTPGKSWDALRAWLPACLYRNTHVYKIRTATFMRRLSARKPTCLLSLERTIEITMASFSRPCIQMAMQSWRRKK